MDEQTLKGTRRLVYTLAKMVKYFTGSGAKSYECKYAVRLVLYNKEPAMDKLGEALRKVLNHPTIRGMFEGVHKDLRKLGVTKVVICENGIKFEGNYHENFQIWFLFLFKYLGLEDDDEELIRRAIALSLEQEDKDVDEEEMMKMAKAMSLA